MRADPTAQASTRELAGIDAELGRLAHQRRTLPEHAELEAAEKRVREAKDAVVRAETRAGDLDRDIRRIERDVEGVRSRAEKDRGLLAGAGVGAKQATDLQHELETLARRQGVLEDEQLEVMEEREAIGAELQHALVTLSEAESAVAAVTERRDAGVADLDAAGAGRDRERAAVVARLPQDLLADYERLRAKGQVAAGALDGARCGACRLELDRTFVSRIRGMDADEVVHCEECGAILVRAR